jgi:hypothetical protein
MPSIQPLERLGVAPNREGDVFRVEIDAAKRRGRF